MPDAIQTHLGNIQGTILGFLENTGPCPRSELIKRFRDDPDLFDKSQSIVLNECDVASAIDCLVNDGDVTEEDGMIVLDRS